MPRYFIIIRRSCQELFCLIFKKFSVASASARSALHKCLNIISYPIFFCQVLFSKFFRSRFAQHRCLRTPFVSCSLECLHILPPPTPFVNGFFRYFLTFFHKIYKIPYVVFFGFYSPKLQYVDGVFLIKPETIG